MVVEVSKKYYLGDFEVEPANHLLKRGDVPVSLSKKRFQVLLYLLEHQGKLVTREELLAQFWDGSNVYEDNLTKCVSEIRKALDDQRKPYRFIETVPAVGYRFIGQLKRRYNPQVRALRLRGHEELRSLSKKTMGKMQPGTLKPHFRGSHPPY